MNHYNASPPERRHSALADCSYCGGTEYYSDRHEMIEIEPDCRVPFCHRCAKKPEYIEAVRKALNQEID